VNDLEKVKEFLGTIRDFFYFLMLLGYLVVNKIKNAFEG